MDGRAGGFVAGFVVGVCVGATHWMAGWLDTCDEGRSTGRLPCCGAPLQECVRTPLIACSLDAVSVTVPNLGHFKSLLERGCSAVLGSSD